MNEDWRTLIGEWPCLVPDFTLAPASTALVVIDMQRCFLEADMGLGALLRARFPSAAEYYESRVNSTVLPNMQRILCSSRRAGLRVVHITVGPELPDGSDFSPLRRATNDHAETRFKALYPRGAPEHAIMPEVAPLPGELVLNKITRSAFNSTSLSLILSNLGIDGLLVCGVQTNACVESTARDAADFGFKCVLVDDACQCFSPVMHIGTMMSFASLFGKVWNTAQVLQWLEAGN